VIANTAFFRDIVNDRHWESTVATLILPPLPPPLYFPKVMHEFDTGFLSTR
jgi:hypothetical protein